MCISVSRTSAIRSADTERARQDDEQHGQHQERHHDLHGVLHEGDHIADLHVRIRHLLCAEPDDEPASHSS